MAAPKDNKNGVNGMTVRDALRYEAAKLGRELDGDDPALKKGLRALAAPIIAKAADGDLASFKEVSDRLDGRPATSLTVSGDEDNPLRTITRIERVIVDVNSED